MNKKVFFTCYVSYIMDVAEKLCEEQNWEPVYWFTMPENEERVKQKFPGTLRHNYNESIRGKLTPELEKRFKGVPLDDKILREYSVEEYDVLNMIDRNDMSRTFSYSERVEYFQTQLSYWLDVLEQLKPDIIFMEALPHEPNDYIIYAIAKRKGIQVLSFCISLFSNRIFPMRNYEEGSPVIHKNYYAKLAAWKGETITLSPELEDRIYKIRGNYSKNLRFDVATGVGIFRNIYEKGPLKKVLDSTLRFFKIFNLAKFPKRMNFLLSLSKPSEHNYQKQPGQNYRDSEITNKEFINLVEQGTRLKKKLHSYYEEIALKEPDMNVPFIYCALHYQPEATTSPLGGYFVNQKLMLRMLSEVVPEGWKIYVKDHIGQFIPNIWGETSRSKEYYDEINSIPNVHIIPLKCDSYTLIDHCKAVATITGTVSFEAPVRGKPALCFGHNLIFNPCEGIFHTATMEKLENAMNIIRSGYKPDPNKVRLYVQAVYESTYPGGIGSFFNSTFMNVTKEENVENHYKATLDFMKFLEDEKAAPARINL